MPFQDNEIMATYKYVYDPSHERRPEGVNWRRTTSGWSRGVSEEESSSGHHSSESSRADSPSSKSNGSSSLSEMPANMPEESGDEELSGEENLQDISDNETDVNLDELDEIEGADAATMNQEEETDSADDSPIVLEEEETEQEEPIGEETNQEDGLASDEADDGVGDDETIDMESQENLDAVSESDDGISEVEEETQEPTDGEDDDLFSESRSEDYLDASVFDDRIDQMNDFVSKFDEGEGRENKITFKAVASNLDWSNLDDVRKYAEYCKGKGIENAEEVLAFLYHQYNADEVQFEKIVDMME